MAPEVARASSHYDRAADVFSFALIIYDVYHRQVPDFFKFCCSIFCFFGLCVVIQAWQTICFLW